MVHSLSQRLVARYFAILLATSGVVSALVHPLPNLTDMSGGDRSLITAVCVVGGGLIGVEVAEILHDRGLHVVFVIRENWYFPLALEHREAGLVAEHMRAHGIDVRLGVNVDAVRRAADDSLRGVTVSPAPHARGAEKGEIDADLVVSAIGVVPNTAFLHDSGIALGRSGAIETDDALRDSLVSHVRAGLGPIAQPSKISFVDALPKTRSGKIMRRLLKAREVGLEEGDTSTLED